MQPAARLGMSAVPAVSASLPRRRRVGRGPAGSLGAIMAALALAPAVAGACHLARMPIEGDAGRLGAVAVTLGAADDARHPTAWQGPVRIAVGSAPACTASDAVAIVEAPLLLGGSILYVPTYSGSNNRLYALDVRTCRVLWRSRAFTGATSLRDGDLMIGQRRVALDRSCRPLGATRVSR